MRQIRAVGHRVLIEPDPVEETTSGGIILSRKDVVAEKNAQERGTVVQFGSSCWKEFGDGDPWCAVGQKVYYPKYSGMKIKKNDDPKDEEFWIVINDEDVVCVEE